MAAPLGIALVRWALPLVMILSLGDLACSGSSTSGQPSALPGSASGVPPIVNPGPPGNVPWIALPDCMGIIPEFQMEWWYYVGDLQGDKGETFSIQLQVLRAQTLGTGLAGQLTLGVVGLGRSLDQSFLWSQGYGIGVAQAIGGGPSLGVVAGDRQFEVALVPLLGFPASSEALLQRPTLLHFLYTGGAAMGTVGATYAISGSGTGGLHRSDPAGTVTPESYSFELNVTDQRGMVLEGSSGYVGTENIQTYEFAQPTLQVTGGTLVLNGTTLGIQGGNLWLDRQGMSQAPNPFPAISSAAPSSSLAAGLGTPAALAALSDSNDALYLGCWMGMNLQNGVSLNVASFWQPAAAGQKQWLTGTSLGLPPMANSFGNLYYPLDASHLASGSAYLYGYDAKDGSFDFDVNPILPSSASPSWTSPVSGHTYATAWDVHIGPGYRSVTGAEHLYLHALVPGCEDLMPDSINAFWEGAVTITTDPAGTDLVGTGFVEQMGYN